MTDAADSTVPTVRSRHGGTIAAIQRSCELLVSDRRRRRIVVAGLAIVACLARSWQLGVDTNFDLLNYHLYKGASFLDGSVFNDVAVAGLGTYLNPVIDVPLGIAVAVFGANWGLIVAMAAIQLACYVAVWRLAHSIRLQQGGEPALAVALFAIVVTGSCAVSIGFTSFGDWVVAALLCESLRAVVVSLIPGPDGTGDAPAGGGAVGRRWARPFVVSGAWAGAAVGLKLTAIPLVVGLSIAILIVFGWKRWGASVVAGLAAIAVTAGPWMLYMQVRYASPLFPFYNGVFGSPSAPLTDNDDARFGASNLRTIAEFPAEMFRGSTKYAEFAFQDWRFLAATALVGVWVVLRVRSARSLRTTDPVLTLLVVSSVVSYLLWVVLFGIYRYFLFGEVLASIVVVLLIFRLVPDTRRATAVFLAVLIVGFGFQRAPNWGRDIDLRSDELRTFIDDLDATPELIVFSGGQPLSYLTTDFPSSTDSIALSSFQTGQILYAAQLQEESDALVGSALDDGSIFAITDVDVATLAAPYAHLALTECRPFESNARPLQFCRVVSP